MADLSVISVAIESSQAASGSRSSTSAINQMTASVGGLDKAIKQLNSTLRAGGGGGGSGGGGGGGSDAGSTLRGFNNEIRSLRNLLFVFFIAKKAIDGVKEAIEATIGTGIQFNRTLETAGLSIAGLVAQTLSLKRNGVELQGIERLTEALPIAQQQLAALQIAGLETAATTEALVDAYQQSFAAATRAKIPLEKILDLTIDITQAAKAIGLPDVQLAQEVRAILEGTIDRNARVAKVLGITNEEVAKWKAAGTLAEELGRKLSSFRLIGPLVQLTFAGILSNVQDLIHRLAGISVQPIFDGLKDQLLAFQGSFLDLTKAPQARKAGDINLILTPLTQTFTDAGSRISEGITSGLDRVTDSAITKLEELAVQLDADRGTVDELSATFDVLGESLANVVDQTDFLKLLKDIVIGLQAIIIPIAAVIDLLRILGNVAAAALHAVASAMGYIAAGFAGLKGDVVGFTANLAFAGREAAAAVSSLKDIGGIIFGGKAITGNLVKGLIDADSGLIKTEQHFRNIKQIQADIKASGVIVAPVGKGGFPLEPLSGATGRRLGIADSATQFYKEQRALLDIAAEAKGASAKSQNDAADRASKTAAARRGASSTAFREQEKEIREIIKLQIEASSIILGIIKDRASAELAILSDQYSRELISSEKYYAGLDRLQQQSSDASIEEIRNAISGIQNEFQSQLDAVGLSGGLINQLFFPEGGVTAEDAIKGVQSVLRNFSTHLQDIFKPQDFQVVKAILEELAKLEKAQNARKQERAKNAADQDNVEHQRRLAAINEEADLAEKFEGDRIEAILAHNRALGADIFLSESRARIETAITTGILTQADAAELTLKIEERARDLRVTGLEQRKHDLETAIQINETRAEQVKREEEILRITSEIAVELSKVFTVSNSTAFFRGLLDEVDTLSDRFDKLGRDIRSILTRSFEGLFTKGGKGFLAEFLQGIADAFRTRAASALSKIFVDILAKIFRPATTGGQSIFDKIIDSIIGVFGKKGGTHTGGVIDKVITILLGGKGGGAGGPGPGGAPLPPGGGIRIEDIPIGGSRRIEDILTGKQGASVTILGNIKTDTVEMLGELRTINQHLTSIENCSCTTTTAPQQSTLGKILNGAIGAAASIAIANSSSIGGRLFGGGGKAATDGGIRIFQDGVGEIFGGKTFSPGGLTFGGGTLTGTGITTVQPQVNITVVANDVNSFAAPQTQLQLAAIMGDTIKKSQNMVG